MDDKDLIWEEIKTEHIISDEWIDFRRSRYRFPDGSEYEPFYSYSRRDFVVIVPFDENGNLICVKQFRQGIHKVTMEFPAGGIEKDEGEDAQLPAAIRELQEETGYVSDEWEHLLTIPSAPAITDNYASLYVARNCKKASGQSLDETEYLNVSVLTPDELQSLIDQNKFEQPIHILAWLLANK